jgi:hypothetical protein
MASLCGLAAGFYAMRGEKQKPAGARSGRLVLVQKDIEKA